MKLFFALPTAVLFGFAPVALADPPDLLLAALLRSADTLSASLTNAAENFAAVTGAVVVMAQGSSDAMAAILPSLTQDRALGAASQVSAQVQARDLAAAVPALALVQVGDVVTTAIGALQSGAMIGSTGTRGTFDTTGLVELAVLQTTSGAHSARVSAETHGSSAQTMVLQNAALNQGQIDGRINLVLRDVNATTARLTSTAIGAMQSGNLQGVIRGNLTHRLVGG